MGIASTRMLVIGVSREHYSRIAPLLERREFEVNRVPSASAALDLMQAVRFDLAVVSANVSDPDLPTLVSDLRDRECASRHASIIALATNATRPVAEALVNRGVSRVLGIDAPAEALEREVASLLETAPRLAIRLPAQLQTHIGKGPGKIFCQTENISSTGMLLRMPRRPEVGEVVEFEIHLPADNEPLRGKATVVRHTQPGREGTDGIGARFDHFRGTDHERLRDFLEKHLDVGQRRPA